MATKQLRFLWVLSVLFSIALACPKNTLFLIKPIVNEDLVLDAIDPLLIRLQKFNGSSTQLWRFEQGDQIGLFYIINNQTGKALDFRPTTEVNFLNLVVKEKANALHQQWALSMKGRITNAESRLMLTYTGEISKQGTVWVRILTMEVQSKSSSLRNLSLISLSSNNKKLNKIKFFFKSTLFNAVLVTTKRLNKNLKCLSKQ